MRYITVIEYLMGRATLDKLSKEIVANINTIVPKANDLLEKFGSFRGVNSGLRTPEVNKATPGASPTSWHLKGAALDFEDSDGKLHAFCKANNAIMEELDIFLEERRGGWQHIQIYPFKSYKKGGSRWFNP